MAYLFILQQMLQFGVGLDALQLVGDNLPHLRTDAVVVLLDHLLHAVVAVGIGEVRDDGDRLVSLLLAPHLLGIHHYLTMKNLLLDALVEVVRHRADEHTLRERGNLARCIDFWGNCWEWTSSTDKDGLYIIKGGSWDSKRDDCGIPNVTIAAAKNQMT